MSPIMAWFQPVVNAGRNLTQRQRALTGRPLGRKPPCDRRVTIQFG
ncbi:MAG: hypothetical protein KF832_24095 [Caldilineaceae bacterium]|nr:hypothetical protein [Caldilineaceae bacterium]